MQLTRRVPVRLLTLLGGLAGCASERPPEARTPSYEALRSQEIESERQEFIQDRRQELSGITEEINNLKAKMSRDGVSDQQRAEWSNSVFELEQDRNRVSAELERAAHANAEEWKQMRGDIPVAVDSLQAGVKKLGNDIAGVFTVDERKVSADSGLCPVAVSDVDTEVEVEGGEVLVEITTSKKQEVGLLQQRAMEMSQSPNYRPSRAEPAVAAGTAESPPESPAVSLESETPSGHRADGEAPPIPLRRVAVQNIDNGVRMTFIVPPEQREEFRDQVSEDARRLAAGDCNLATPARRLSRK